MKQQTPPQPRFCSGYVEGYAITPSFTAGYWAAIGYVHERPLMRVVAERAFGRNAPNIAQKDELRGAAELWAEIETDRMNAVPEKAAA